MNQENPAKSQNSEEIVKNKPYLFKKGHKKMGGAKKGVSFSLNAILKHQLQQIPPELKGKERKIYADLLVKKLLHKAIIEGDEQSIKLIWSYVEGTPKGNMDVTSGGRLLVPSPEKIKAAEKAIAVYLDAHFTGKEGDQANP